MDIKKPENACYIFFEKIKNIVAFLKEEKYYL